MSYHANKERIIKSSVSRPFQQDLDKAPRQFCEYMAGVNNRFNEICKLYLDGMSMDDVKFLKPDDLINLVPDGQFKHKLLMTIMVRRYLYRPDDDETVLCKSDKGDTFEYSCNNCDHACTNPNCTHSCEDYVKLCPK